MSLASKAGAYCPRPSPLSQSATSMDIASPGILCKQYKFEWLSKLVWRPGTPLTLPLTRVPPSPRWRARACTDLTARQAAGISPSPPLGAERVGVRWGSPVTNSGATHLTLPAQPRRAPPSPPASGRRGARAHDKTGTSRTCVHALALARGEGMCCLLPRPACGERVGVRGAPRHCCPHNSAML
jgi:hypothetical protein